MPTRSKLGSSHQGSSVFAVPIQEPKPNRSMMEPAEDWYRSDAADEDFFNSLLGLQTSVRSAPPSAQVRRRWVEPRPALPGARIAARIAVDLPGIAKEGPQRAVDDVAAAFSRSAEA